jgi:ABC-type oligopeptide transport system substrate-binding subunit
LVPPLQAAYPAVAGPAFDPQEARLALARFLARNGGDMPRLEYLYPSSDFNRTLAEILQQEWSRNLGVDVALVNQESKTFFPAQRGLEYQISHSSWVGDYLDPTTFLDNFVGASGNNRTGFADARYEELLQWAATCGDPVLRLELLAEAERLLLDQAVILPLLVDVDMALVAEDLKGLTPNAAGIIDWAALHP